MTPVLQSPTLKTMAGPDAKHRNAHAPASRLTRALTIGLAASLAMVAVEAVAGYLSGSLALLTDAGHLLVDSMGLALALLATVLARRPPDLRRTYGYARVEVLFVPVQVALMLALAAFVGYESISRIGENREIDALPVFLAGVAGLVVNLWVLRLVGGHGHENLNARAAFYEVLSDAFGSAGVIISAVVLVLTGWTFVDVIVSLAIASLLLPKGFSLLRHTVRVLLEGAPQGTDIQAIERDAQAVEGVKALHDLHVWSLTPSFTALSAHVEVDSMDGCGEPIASLTRMLRERHGIVHVTLQPETAELHNQIDCCLYPDAARVEHEHAR